MVDIVITPGNVIADQSAKITDGTAGATITAGQWVYLDGTVNQFKLADADGAAALRSPVGAALHGASAGQPLKVATSGPVTIGGTLAPGVAYYLSKTAGGLAPVADIAAGGYATVLGIAISATVLRINITESGVAV